MGAQLYLPYNKWLHRLDPRTKMMLAFAVTILVFTANHPLYQAIILTAVLLAGAFNRVLSNIKRIRVLILSVSLFSVIVWPFFADGQTPLLGPVSLEALQYAMTCAFRIVTVMVVGLLFLSTTRTEEMTLGLIRMKLPYNVGFAFSMAVRLIPMILDMTGTIIQAQTSRGLNLQSGSILQRVRKHLPLLIPVFVTTIRSTNRLAMAVESKGFGASPNRTYFLNLKFERNDFTVMGLALLLIGSAVMISINELFQIQGLIR